MTVSQVVVDRLPLGCAHRLELDRPPEAHSLRSSAIRLALERLLAARAVAGGVHDNRLTLVGIVEGRAPRQVLERVDRLAMAADQPAEFVRPVDGRADLIGVL